MPIFDGLPSYESTESLTPTSAKWKISSANTFSCDAGMDLLRVAADEILDRKLEQEAWRRLHDHMQTTSMQVITTEKVKKAVLKKYSKAMDHDDIYFVERSYPDVDELTSAPHLHCLYLSNEPSQCNEVVEAF